MNEMSPAGNVAHLRHELLTPLNHILGFTNILMDEAGETGLDRFLPLLARLSDGGHTLLDSVQSTLRSDAIALSIAEIKTLEESLRPTAEQLLEMATFLVKELRDSGHEQTLEDVEMVSSAVNCFLTLVDGMAVNE